ncbi:MAG: hypothetical protein ABIY55_01930 [Kofleriaceae bacterium]
MQIRVHGLAPREGETAFAFLVLRLATPVDRDGLADLIGQLALLVPDAERFATELPEECEAAMRLVGIPWSPPIDAAAFEAQRQLIEGAGLHGIEEAWFFQTGTSLPLIAADEDDEDDEDNEDDDDDDEGGPGGADEEASWSHGPLPQLDTVRFPVDGYPTILDELDWEDFGIAVKLGGAWTSGETTVLLGFHAMWLTPYGGRYRNAGVTIDPVHHAAHFWVDRFAVSCAPHEQVHHLLWIVSKLDEIAPVVHARFGGATMAQKYSNLAGDLRETFVLGGNPLLAIYAREGEVGVDAWIATQTAWSPEEIAPMLRELAIDLVTERDPEPAEVERVAAALDGGTASEDDDVDAMFEAAGIGEDEDDAALEEGTASLDDAELEGSADAEDADAEDADADAEDADAEDADAEVEDADAGEDAAGEDAAPDAAEHPAERAAEAPTAPAPAREPRTRELTAHVGNLLTTRAYLGKLDRRAAAALRPALATTAKYEHRRTAIVAILGAMRDRESVPAMIRILETTPIASALDAIGKEDLVTATVRALGMIGDPRAIAALSNQIIVPGAHNDEPRVPAALALSSCMAAATAPPEPPVEVFEALLRTLHDLDDDDAAETLRVAYSALAARSSPARRDRALARLHALERGRAPSHEAADALDADEDDDQVN